jgi:dihydroxyacetone kinase-like predicted kinase
MGLDSSKIKAQSSKFSSGDSMAMAAQSLSGDASEEDVRDAVSEIVATMLEERWAIVRWVIGEEWAAKLVARIVDAVGQTILEWLR